MMGVRPISRNVKGNVLYEKNMLRRIMGVRRANKRMDELRMEVGKFYEKIGEE